MLVQQSIGNDLDFFIHVFHFFHLLVVFPLFEVHPSGTLNKQFSDKKQRVMWAATQMRGYERSDTDPLRSNGGNLMTF